MGFIKIEEEKYGIVFGGKEYEIKCSAKKWMELQGKLQGILKNKEGNTDKDMTEGMIMFVHEMIPELNMEDVSIFDLVKIMRGIREVIEQKTKNELSPAK